MKNHSIYAILSGMLGFIFFSASQYLGDHLNPPTSAQTSGIYIFAGLGLLMFIVSIVFGVQGYRNHKGSKAIGCVGALFTPFLVILAIGYFILTGWAAFMR